MSAAAKEDDAGVSSGLPLGPRGQQRPWGLGAGAPASRKAKSKEVSAGVRFPVALTMTNAHLQEHAFLLRHWAARKPAVSLPALESR